jgi:Domain of unknown function (DUF4386)
MPTPKESGARWISRRLAAGLASAPALNSARQKLEDIVLKIGNAAHFRRTVAGLCLLAAPLLFAVAIALAQQPSGSAAAQLASYAQHRDQLLAGLLLGIASSILFVPALFGLLHQIRERGVVYAHLAAILMVYGAVTAAALWGVNAMFWEMAKPGMNHSAMATLLNGIEHASAVGAPLLAGHYLFALGVILLGVAVWRARLAPRWAGILVVLFPVSDVALNPVGSVASALISGAIGVTGLGALGLHLLATPDAEWAANASPPAMPAPQPQPQPQPSQA